MTPAPRLRPRFDAEAYLEWERGNEIRHEYFDGEVFAMVGARDAHVTVVGNLFVLLRNHTRGGPCRVYMADMKLRVEAADAFFYPDVMVTCHPDDRSAERDYFKQAPVLVAEVLSDSTAGYDRGRKFAAYRKLPELCEYLIVDPDELSVELYRRDAEGRWVLYPSVAGETVELASLDLRFPIENLYEDVEFRDVT
ncbi:Uma2 family endonuclease [Endothiovibrio diazotrophicus]